MKLVDKGAEVLLGARLRLLAVNLIEDAAEVYELYNWGCSAKWFPVLITLAEEGAETITEIASETGHSQSLVSN